MTETKQIEALTRLCQRVIDVHAHVVMDTPEDRDLHDRAVATFRRHLALLTSRHPRNDETTEWVGVRHADGMMNEARVAQVEEHRGCRQFEGTPSQAVSEVAGSSPAPANPSPTASTDPAPEVGLREAVQRLCDAAEWSVEHSLSRTFTGEPFPAVVPATELRRALAAHPAPETPEQVQGGGFLAGLLADQRKTWDERHGDATPDADDASERVCPDCTPESKCDAHWCCAACDRATQNADDASEPVEANTELDRNFAASTDASGALTDLGRMQLCVCPDFGPVMPGDTHTLRCSEVWSIVAARVSAAATPARAKGWDEGVQTALDHAVRNEDGITLSLDRRNPYRSES